MRPLTVFVGAIATLQLAACSVPTEERVRVADDDTVPFDLLDPEAEPVLQPVPSDVGEPVSVCFVQDDHLAVVQLALDAPVGLGDLIVALGDTPPAADPSLRTALDAELVRRVRLVAGVARVDLRQEISDLGGDDQLLAVAQIVCTYTSRPGIGLVSFTLEGNPIDVPRADGSLVRQPVSRDDYASLLP